MRHHSGNKTVLTCSFASRERQFRGRRNGNIFNMLTMFIYASLMPLADELLSSSLDRLRSSYSLEQAFSPLPETPVPSRIPSHRKRYALQIQQTSATDTVYNDDFDHFLQQTHSFKICSHSRALCRFYYTIATMRTGNVSQSGTGPDSRCINPLCRWP